MAGMRWRIGDLPPHLKAQVLRQFDERVAHNAQKPPSMASQGKRRPSNHVKVKKAPRGKFDGSADSHRATPNRTEAEYNRNVLQGRGIYEPVVLRLAGGNYTPDWMTVEDGQVVFHECKGAFRFPSESRAVLAFRTAAAQFPCFRFIWAQKQKHGSWLIKHDLNAKHGEAIPENTEIEPQQTVNVQELAENIKEIREKMIEIHNVLLAKSNL